MSSTLFTTSDQLQLPCSRTDPRSAHTQTRGYGKISDAVILGVIQTIRINKRTRDRGAENDVWIIALRLSFRKLAKDDIPSLLSLQLPTRDYQTTCANGAVQCRAGA